MGLKSYAVLFVLMIALAACANTSLSGERIVVEDVSLDGAQDSCAGVACGSGAVCQDGACVCTGGFKQCDDACIAQDACCSADECGEGEECVDGQCRFSCDQITCSANRVCDATSERCICAEGYRFCEDQAKCIPEDHCCNRFDCGIDERCLPTITSSEVCLSSGKLRACKVVDEREQKTLEIQKKHFGIAVENFFYLGRVDLLVDNRSVALGPGESIAVDTAIDLSVGKMREKGGRCLDFDLDQES